MPRNRRSIYREPSGKRQRPSAREKAQDMQQAAYEARQRVFRLTESQARAMPETTVLGRYRAMGELSMRQYEAGARYAGIVRDYDAAMLVKGLPKAGDLDRGHGHDNGDGTDPDYVADFRTSVRRFDECEAALEAAKIEDKMAKAVVNAIALSDQDAPHFIPALRIGLNHLARVFRLPVNDESRRAEERASA